MQPWQTIERALTPDGTELVLARRGEEWVVRAAGQVLMSSRVHGSEETLAKYALERVTAPKRVLVGGLGLGFTLRAALDGLAREARVEVVELVPELVEWNRTHIAHLAEEPLDDPRVVVAIGDVYDKVVAATGTLDLLVLDVDNGPSALTQGRNGRLYSEAGTRKCAGALRTGGVLALWSASSDERYRKNLEAAGFSVEMKTVAARPGSGARDVLFLAKRMGASGRTSS
jgi:spermidine synthase